MDDEDVRRLHADGFGCNEIARQLGARPSTISRRAKRLGLAFDRAATKVATAAKVEDAKARRAALMLAYLGDAEKLRGQLWRPLEYREHGGRDFLEVRWTQDEPTAADKLKLMQSSTLAATHSLKLDQHDRDTGDEGATSMLGALAAGLQVAYEQIQADGGA